MKFQAFSEVFTATGSIVPRTFVIAVVLFAMIFLPARTAANDADNTVGPNACAECHKEEAEVWKKTHHFTTFRDMPRSKEAREIADKLKIKRIKSQSLCLGCHFTTEKKGKRTKPVAGISCESCHAAGKEWIKEHSEFSGKTEETETKSEAAARWKKSEARGMIRPSAIYKLAKNCYGCHVVPREELVNKGGHPAGSAFELVSWSQGEIRHNLWYTKGKSNPAASKSRQRLLYAVGLVVELETALRAIAVATKRDTYAVQMAKRADAARRKLAQAAKAAPAVPELATIVRLGYSAGLKLNNKKALTGAADRIAGEAVAIVGKYDGDGLAGLDAMIPGADKYKGKPAK